MVLKAEPLRLAMQEATRRVPAAQRILLAADGRPLTQARVAGLAQRPELVLVAGRYEGVDERFVEACIDESLSVGDVVLSGGELPALMVIDAVARLLPARSATPSRRCRSRSRTGCSTGRTTRGRRAGTGGRCRRCCSAATMRPSTAGGASRRWGGPGSDGPTSSAARIGQGGAQAPRRVRCGAGCAADRGRDAITARR